MSEFREFSIRRRRTHLLDIITPMRTGIAGYSIQWASNFDVAFATIISNLQGYRDPTIPQAVLDPAPGQNCRFVFDPASYGITDDDAFWLKLLQHDATGATVATSAPVLVVPERERHARLRIAIAGAAPSGATVLDSLKIYLPFGAANLFVHNRNANKSMFLAFNPTGPEIELEPNALPEFPTYEGQIEVIYVRGDGISVNFGAHFILSAPV